MVAGVPYEDVHELIYDKGEGYIYTCMGSCRSMSIRKLPSRHVITFPTIVVINISPVELVR